MAGGAAPRLNSSPNGVHLTGEAHQTPASQDISTNQKQQDRQEQPHQRRHQSNQPLASQLNRNKTCYTALNAHIYNILIAHSKGREPLLRYPNLRPSNTLTTQDARPPPICPPPDDSSSSFLHTVTPTANRERVDFSLKSLETCSYSMKREGD